MRHFNGKATSWIWRMTARGFPQDGIMKVRTDISTDEVEKSLEALLNGLV